MTSKSFTFLIIVLGSLMAIGPLAIDMYLPAFSDMAKYFSVPTSKIELTLSSYFIGVAIGQILYGPIIDRFGKKLPLIFGLAIFVIASILCANSQTIEQMIYLRFIQAIGACACFVVMRAIVRDLFSNTESAQVFSYLLLVMGIAPIIAPMLGGLVLKHFSWQAIFWFLGLFATLLIIVSILYLPKSKSGDKNEKLRNAFKKYWEILHDKNFLFYSLSGGLSASGMFIFIAGSPFVIIEVFGINPQNYSYIFGMNALGYVVAAQINARLLKFLSLNKILNSAFTISFFAAILLAVVSIYLPNIWVVSFALFIYISLIGIITPNSTALALSHQKVHSGSASALFGTIQFTICSIGVFIMSFCHNQTILPMTLTISTCGIIAFFINYWGKKISKTKL